MKLVVWRILWQFRRMPVVRNLRFAFLRRLKPLKNGGPTGTPVVRYYWAHFLDRYRGDIKGRALEIGTTWTIREYGGDAVTQPEAMDMASHSSEVTVVADLSRADHVPSDTYDCFLNQFVACVVYDIDAALYHAIRILKPGGVLLINFSSVEYYFFRGLDMGTGGAMYMHHFYTPINIADRLHRLGLTDKDYTLEVYGNLLTRMAFLMNLPAEELTRSELDHRDPAQPLLICARIVKPVNWNASRPEYREPLWLPKERPHPVSPTTGHYGDHYGP